MPEFKALANQLADAARIIARQYFRTDFAVEVKDDESPVTIADRMIEETMREIIEKERPEDGILGEEFGVKDSQNGLMWVLDPIDGTKSFVMGRPTFGTLIALCDAGKPVLGVIDQPIIKERWVGATDGQTFFNGQKVSVRDCKDLSKATICSTTPAMFDKTGPAYKGFPEGKMAWGGDCYMYGMLASGHHDVCLEAALSPYDFAALVPVVIGAGGVMTDWEGHALTLKSDGRVLACATKELHDQCVETIRIGVG